MQSITSHMKWLLIKLLKLITCKAKPPFLSCALSCFLSLPFPSRQNQGITASTYFVLWATKTLSHRASRQSVLPPLCRAAPNEGIVHCFRPFDTADLLWGPLFGLSVLRADSLSAQGASSQNANNRGTRTFKIR